MARTLTNVDPVIPGGGKGSITIGFQDPGLRKLTALQRNLNTGASKAILAAHQAMINDLQKLAGDELNDAIKSHPNRSGYPRRPHSNNLLRALRDPANSTKNLAGIAYGLPKYLDSEASKVGPYWRNLEQGTDIFKGRRLLVWGRGGAHDLRDLSKLKTSRTKQELNDRATSMNVKGRSRMNKAQLSEATNTKGKLYVTVKNSIQAYRYLATTKQKFLSDRAGLVRYYAHAFKSLLGRDFITEYGKATKPSTKSAG